MEKLPNEVIQHIQSFMNGKEAARTTLVSKSWFSAWLTRPNLSFNQVDDFQRRQSLNAFSEFTKYTMERYEVSNLKILSFYLQIRDTDHSLAKELIVRAIKLGATDVEIKIPFSGSQFVLPDEVLESPTLARLSVSGFRVDLRRRVACSHLKSLTLHDVDVDGDLFTDLLSRCPLIESLSLDSLFFRVDDYLWCNKLPSLLKDVHIRAVILCLHKGFNTASWLSSLSKLVKMLSHYRLSLTVDVDVLVLSNGGDGDGDGDGSRYVGDGLPRSVLETLTIKSHVIPSFLDNLFLICRPKMIVQEYVGVYPINEELVELEGHVKLSEERFRACGSRVIRFQIRWNLANSAARSHMNEFYDTLFLNL